MSLSVLIPVYNKDVTALVAALSGQLRNENIPGEILLLDDASAPAFDSINRHLAVGDFIIYQRNKINHGRVLTRQLLAEKAKYDFLLFLDCDVIITQPDFIRNYLDQLKNGVQVCGGGLVYDKEPADCKFKLHWNYGVSRECKRKNNENGFLASNFLIRKDLFLGLDFNTLANVYGHEDTLWNIQLSEKGIRSRSIDNPVLHEGLTETNEYISRSLQAVENILVLEKKIGTATVARHISLLGGYQKANTFFMSGIIGKLESVLHKKILANLNSCNPSLFYFDLLRLAHLIRLKKGI